jgi:hypothetical protein
MSLELYNKVRSVPKEALKEIQAGRLRGKSDINPMWRIKLLTECFGECGIGWKINITRQWLEPAGNGEIAAFCNIELMYVDKQTGAWSEPVPGTGGSMFVANEKNGAYTSDECYKMALTDAISVACKALGFGADVYWDKDATKYDVKPQQTKPSSPASNEPKPATSGGIISDAQLKRLYSIATDKDKAKAVMAKYGYASSKEIKTADYEKICKEIEG